MNYEIRSNYAIHGTTGATVYATREEIISDLGKLFPAAVEIWTHGDVVRCRYTKEGFMANVGQIARTTIGVSIRGRRDNELAKNRGLPLID